MPKNGCRQNEGEDSESHHTVSRLHRSDKNRGRQTHERQPCEAAFRASRREPELANTAGVAMFAIEQLTQ